MSVRLSNHNSDAGIGLVRYVHSLIGLAATTISNRDVDDRCQCILAKDKALTTEGSDLNRLRQDVLQLMIVLSQKYLSLRLSKANVYLDPDPFKDDRSMLSEDISSGSSEHDNDSTWDPGKDEYNNITDNSCGDDNFDNEGDQDDSDQGIVNATIKMKMYDNSLKIACVTNVTSSAYNQTRLMLQEHAEYIMEQSQHSVRWTPKDYHTCPNQKLSQTTKEYLISE